MRDYHDLYLKTDVFLLADVFESFRKSSLESHGLNPSQYYTSPGLSMAACLKYTDVKLELMTDIDVLLMLEGGVRGGVSSIMNRYSKANNKYMPDCNPNEPSKYILYLDANNLYGGALSDYLPTGGLTFLSEEETMDFHLDSISAKNENG